MPNGTHTKIIGQLSALMSVYAVSPQKRLAVAIFSSFAGIAGAGGFDLPTITASQQGTSNANGAEASDPSVIYYNPAGLARMKSGLQVSQGFSALVLNGKVAVDADGTRGTPGMDEHDGRTLADQPPTDGEAGSFWPRIIAAGGLFVSLPVDDMVTAGIGVFAPGGGNINYKSDWSGAFQIDNIALEFINVNPSIGIRFDDKHSLGFGVSTLVGHVRQKAQIGVQDVAPYLLRDAVNDGALDVASLPLGGVIDTACGGLSPALCYRTTADLLISPDSRASVKVEMYGYGFGWNVGYLFAPTDTTRMGLAYRSESKLKMRGDLDWDFSQVKGTSLYDSTLMMALGSLDEYLSNNLHPDATAKGDIAIPARGSANIFHQLNNKIDLMADFTFIQSSVIDKITVQFLDVKKGDKTIKQGDGGITANWRDSYKVSVGGNYRHDDKLMLRSGFQYDKTPIPSAEYRHPGAPDSDRYMFSIGANYKVKKGLTVDAAYSLVLLADSESNYRDTCRATSKEDADGNFDENGAACTSNGGTFKGRFYDTSIHVLSAQINQRF